MGDRPLPLIWYNGKGKDDEMSDNELLELIAELNMSDDKSRQALWAEIKRLTASLRSRLEELEKAVEEAREVMQKAAGGESVVQRADRWLIIYGGSK